MYMPFESSGSFVTLSSQGEIVELVPRRYEAAELKHDCVHGLPSIAVLPRLADTRVQPRTLHVAVLSDKLSTSRYFVTSVQSYVSV